MNETSTSTIWFLLFLLPITIYCFRFVLIERKGTDYCIFPNFYLVYMVFHLFSQYIDITVAIDLTNIHLKLQSVRASSIRAAGGEDSTGQFNQSRSSEDGTCALVASYN